MKQILLIILASFFLSSSLIAEDIKMEEIETYISISKKIDFNNIKEENEIFFGEYDDYVEKTVEEYKSIKKGLGEGLSSGLGTTSSGVASSIGNTTGKVIGQGVGMGLGIGLIYGVSGAIYQKLTENDVFVLVQDYTDINGNKSRIVSLFYAKSFDNKDIIKKLLVEKINNKIKLN